MKKLLSPGSILLIVVIIIGLTVWGSYNRLVGLEEGVDAAWSQRGFAAPQWAGGVLWEVLSLPVGQWIGFLSVIVPMGLFNLAGSLQNIESAEAAGDSYDTRSALAVNGLGTLVAASFGSCFPTTIYIGHPGWKGLGARAGYSTLNGISAGPDVPRPDIPEEALASTASGV